MGKDRFQWMVYVVVTCVALLLLYYTPFTERIDQMIFAMSVTGIWFALITLINWFRDPGS